jgi:hypothetical protein
MLKCIASASKNENYLQLTLIYLTINSILNPHYLYNYTILGSKSTSYKTTYTKKCLNFYFFHTLKFININFLWISKRQKQSYKATRALCIYRYLVSSIHCLQLVGLGVYRLPLIISHPWFHPKV